MAYNYLKVLLKFKIPKTYKLKDVFYRADYYQMFFGSTKPYIQLIIIIQKN